MHYFQEKQRPKQWWLLLLLVPFIIALVIENNRHGWQAMDWLATLIPFVIVFVLFAIIQLNTTISQEGIAITMFPFIIKQRMFKWEDIQRASVRTYKPLKEYGGWGLKGTRKNRAYNMNGKEGLQLELKDGRKVLIGTDKSAEIESTLKMLGKL